MKSNILYLDSEVLKVEMDKALKKSKFYKHELKIICSFFFLRIFFASAVFLSFFFEVHFFIKALSILSMIVFEMFRFKFWRDPIVDSTVLFIHGKSVYLSKKSKFYSSRYIHIKNYLERTSCKSEVLKDSTLEIVHFFAFYEALLREISFFRNKDVFSFLTGFFYLFSKDKNSPFLVPYLAYIEDNKEIIEHVASVISTFKPSETDHNEILKDSDTINYLKMLDSFSIEVKESFQKIREDNHSVFLSFFKEPSSISEISMIDSENVDSLVTKLNLIVSIIYISSDNPLKSFFTTIYEESKNGKSLSLDFKKKLSTLSSLFLYIDQSFEAYQEDRRTYQNIFNPYYSKQKLSLLEEALMAFKGYLSETGDPLDSLDDPFRRFGNLLENVKKY